MLDAQPRTTLLRPAPWILGVGQAGCRQAVRLMRTTRPIWVEACRVLGREYAALAIAIVSTGATLVNTRVQGVAADAFAMAGVAAWPSATKTAPAMTSGIPFVNSRTWFRIQLAAISLEASASSALSNTRMLMSTSGPPSSKKYSRNPGCLRNSGTKLSCTRRATSPAAPRVSENFRMIVNMFLPPGQARAGHARLLRPGGMRESLIAQDAIQALAGKALRPASGATSPPFPSCRPAC
jgi:hypothetical protein